MREHSWMRSTKEFFYFVRLPFSSDCGIYPRDKNTLVVFDFFFKKESIFPLPVSTVPFKGKSL